MSRFKVGQKVYMGRGEHLQELIVEEVIDNPMLPIYQYTFEGKNFACGEQSIRATKNGRDLKISECYKEDSMDIDDVVATNVNTIAAGKRHPIRMEEHFTERSFYKGNLFFRPDFKFCDWLKDYANGRLIIDVGAGQGHLVRMLKMRGAKAIGLEPNFDHQKFMQIRMSEGGDVDVNEILPMTIQEAKNIVAGLGEGNKAMLVFARPCHSTFVEEGMENMPKGMEALYITVPRNLELFNDMGRFKDTATLLEHEGVSEDDEVVYSVIR